jgi:hypothetical protein
VRFGWVVLILMVGGCQKDNETIAKEPEDASTVEWQVGLCGFIDVAPEKFTQRDMKRCRTVIAPAAIRLDMPILEKKLRENENDPKWMGGYPAPARPCFHMIEALHFGERGSWWRPARDRVSKLCCERRTPSSECNRLPKE